MGGSLMNAGKRPVVTRKGLAVGLSLVFLLAGLVPAGTAVQAGPDQPGLGAAWRLPFIRVDHTAIFDAPNDRIIVFGGWNGRQFFNDVWALDMADPDSADWTKLNPDGAWPPSRGQHTAVYDAANQRMIIFGGHGLHYNFDDVWALDLTPGAEAWTELSPTGLPIGARRYHSAVYDETNERMVVFGGGGRGGLRNDAWALHLSTPGAEVWSQLAVTGSVPASRWQHTAIYDSVNGLMVVFGGAGGGALFNDTWALNLTTLHWAELSAAGDLPPARRMHSATYQDDGTVTVFGGLGSGGFLNDLWYLKLPPNSIEWIQVSANPSPATRAGHTATQISYGDHMIVLGGRGMGSLAGETQWVYDWLWVSWSPLTPDLPGWWSGTAVQSMQTNGMPDVTLQIEDAAPGTRVHLLPNQEVWFVVKLKTVSDAYKDDVDVILDVVAPKFEVVQVGTRHRDWQTVSNWTTPDSLGGGQYRINDVDLTVETGESSYSQQVVFKANVKPGVSGGTAITARAEGPGWTSVLESPAQARIHLDPPAWIVTSRTLLLREYDDSAVLDMLEEAFEQASGRSAVVLYADRYLPELTTWDNSAVDYTDETTANEVADAVADWLVDWVVNWNPYPTFAYPTYLVLVGDDNTIPFYRQYDDLGHEGIYSACASLEPLCTELVSENYYFTDNAYADHEYGTFYQDWEDGGLEASVGRIVGATAQDMYKALHHGGAGPDADLTRAIIASGKTDVFDWWVPGPDVETVVRQNWGYTVDTSFIDNDPGKTRVVDEMQQGFAIAAFAHHGEATQWSVPGPSGPDWENTEWPTKLMSYEVTRYDPNMPFHNPFFYFDACRVGLSYSSGWQDPGNPYDTPLAYDDTMVYALNYWGASGVVASAGLMYYMRGNNDTCCGEDLARDFWLKADAQGRSDPLGWALRTAKRAFPISSDYDRKTVQTFTYFGLPWMRLTDHSPASQAATAAPSYTTSDLWSMPAPAASPGSYALTAHIDASTYVMSTTIDGFDLIDVAGLSQRTADGQVVLPRATLEVLLPLSATINTLAFTPTQAVALPGLDLPTAMAGTDSGGGPSGGNTPTADGLYPVTATVQSNVLDTYQLVRVYVVPVTYDATADQATLYQSVDVRLEYNTPETLALTAFETDQIQYLPGETIDTATHLVNSGDATETVTATLVIQNFLGQVMGLQGSGAFDVPAGGAYDLNLGWTGSLDGDKYVARVFIWQGGQVVAGAGREIVVTAGEIGEPSAPQQLQPGEEGTFALTFHNLGAAQTIAVGSLAILDEDDALVSFLEPQLATVAGGGSATLTFHWTPAAAGTYKASFVVAAGGQEYGPLAQGFDVAHQVYLPLVLRN